jgi:hypothetical protein
LGTAPSTRFAYGYALPTDPWCLWVPKSLNEDLTYEIKGRNLLTDEGSATITFIKRMTDPGLFDALLIDAIAERLASTLALPLTGIPTIGTEKWKLYQLKLIEARTMDAMEGELEEYVSDELINVR